MTDTNFSSTSDNPMRTYPTPFVAQMNTLLGSQAEAFWKELSQGEPYRAVRLNPLKATLQTLREALPFVLPPTPTPFSSLSFYVPASARLGALGAFHSGMFYAQEPSAAAAVTVLDPQPGERILDLCASPGGKSSQIAALTGDKGLLWSNEIDWGRMQILDSNLERMGIMNRVVSCAHPAQLCAETAGQFDRVLVDAPCSGEGMFRRDTQAIAQWSIQAQKACAIRQSEILESAAQALRPGGILVYSTCTFSPTENEDVIESFLLRHKEFVPDFPTHITFGSPALRGLPARRITPVHGGEGHFVARLKKISTASEPFPNTGMDDKKQKRRGQHDRKSGNGENGALYQPVSRAQISSCANIWEQCFTTPLDDSIRQRLFWLGDTIRLCPPGIDPLQYSFPLRVGFAVVCRVSSLANSKSNAANSHTRTRGYTNKNRMQSSRSHEIDLIPCHAAFMAHPAALCRQTLCLTHDDTRLSSFLQGMEIPCSPKLSGYVAVCCDGVVTGFGKAVNGRLKNKYPKGLRLQSAEAFWPVK